MEKRKGGKKTQNGFPKSDPGCESCWYVGAELAWRSGGERERGVKRDYVKTRAAQQAFI